PRELEQEEADRPLADDQHRLPALDGGLAHGLEAGVDRLHEQSLVVADAVGDRDGARLHDPGRGFHELGVAAARGLEAPRGPVLLVGLALRVGVPAAVEARPAGHVVVDDDALALAEALDARTQAGHAARDLVAEDPWPGEEPLLDLLDVRAADAGGEDPPDEL